ncbi:hypothetical protein AaE_011857 [Aphanomyces astaci]|uniref:Uncharacterized protein n=1 Tax=Aphanomyces astaci TaxID=112090 RepID=A0A6A4ZL09_APHAT|nr:hypothetical protein AaE_011857 [Aphanomyces astaci]
MPVKLAVVDDGVTYLRGDALSHWYSNDLVDNLPTKKSKMADMQALGYNPVRMQADLRMTMGLPIQNTTKTQNFAVPFYRVHPWSRHVQYVAILIGKAGFLASRKTVQWHDRSPDKVESVIEKLMDMVVPKYFPRLSYAIRFDLFCYNSDLFVLLFVVSNVLDMNQAIQYIREVNAYNALSPQWDMTVKLFALSTRLLWLNVGLVKLAKMALHFVSSATYSGHSRVMNELAQL